MTKYDIIKFRCTQSLYTSSQFLHPFLHPKSTDTNQHHDQLSLITLRLPLSNYHSAIPHHVPQIPPRSNPTNSPATSVKRISQRQYNANS